MRKSFLLRISPELWEELNRWAADDLRSINGQIEFLLREVRAVPGRIGVRNKRVELDLQRKAAESRDGTMSQNGNSSCRIGSGAKSMRSRGNKLTRTLNLNNSTVQFCIGLDWTGLDWTVL